MLERAYELAGSGSVANLDQLARTLKREGYDAIEAHLRCSPSLNRELRAKCTAAWIAAGNDPLPERRSV